MSYPIWKQHWILFLISLRIRNTSAWNWSCPLRVPCRRRRPTVINDPSWNSVWLVIVVSPPTIVFPTSREKDTAQIREVSSLRFDKLDLIDVFTSKIYVTECIFIFLRCLVTINLTHRSSSHLILVSFWFRILLHKNSLSPDEPYRYRRLRRLKKKSSTLLRRHQRTHCHQTVRLPPSQNIVTWVPYNKKDEEYAFRVRSFQILSMTIIEIFSIRRTVRFTETTWFISIYSVSE